VHLEPFMIETSIGASDVSKYACGRKGGVEVRVWWLHVNLTDAYPGPTVCHSIGEGRLQSRGVGHFLGW